MVIETVGDHSAERLKLSEKVQGLYPHFGFTLLISSSGFTLSLTEGQDVLEGTNLGDRLSSFWLASLIKKTVHLWETDFHIPPVLGGAALFDNSAPAVYKNLVP